METREEGGKMLGWHWLSPRRRLRFNGVWLDEVGSTQSVDPPIRLHDRGLHASERIIDSLSYAPGPIVCRVELSGEIIRGNDRAVATERTVLAMADATAILHEFSCLIAEHLLGHWGAAGGVLRRAIDVKRAWARGEESYDMLREAIGDARGVASGDDFARTCLLALDHDWEAARHAAVSLVRAHADHHAALAYNDTTRSYNVASSVGADGWLCGVAEVRRFLEGTFEPMVRELLGV